MAERGTPDEFAPQYAPPWPLATALVRAERDSFVAALRDPAAWDLPTRCPPWTVLDIAKHVAATFHRYTELLRRARAGERRPPFAPRDLGAENLRAVREFTGDAVALVCEETERFCSLATDPDEPMINQRGTIPVGLQMLWGLNELAIHHDDVAAASGGAYRPPDATLDALVPMWERSLLSRTRRAGTDAWEWILRGSSR